MHLVMAAHCIRTERLLISLVRGCNAWPSSLGLVCSSQCELLNRWWASSHTHWLWSWQRPRL